MKRAIPFAAAIFLFSLASPHASADKTWTTDGGVIVLERQGKEAPAPPAAPPASPPPLAASRSAESEAKANLKALFTAEMAYFQEHERFSDDLADIGFVPEACPDGTKPATVGRRSASGCFFVYKVVLAGQGPQARFIGYAYGAAPAVKGVEFQVFSDGEGQGIPKRVDRAP